MRGCPASFLPVLFGPDTSVQPIYHCAPVGAWVSGWTVVTTLPDGQGTHAFVLREYESRCGIETEWVNLSRGSRINVLTRAVGGPAWAASDVSGLMTKVYKRAAKVAADAEGIDAAWVLNDEPLAWVLRHVMGLLDEEEQSTMRFLLSFSPETSAHGLVDRLLRAADHAAENWTSVDAAEETTIAAAQRVAGVTLTGSQLELIRIPGVLLTFPRDSWEREADRLIRAAFAPDGIGATFRPTPRPSPPKTTAAPARWPAGWPLAG